MVPAQLLDMPTTILLGILGPSRLSVSLFSHTITSLASPSTSFKNKSSPAGF
ncbi:hypothetical protein BDZ89DRAFT_1062020 [Hymenopellis radicata]|nr:hypothetical protein BDZ89DRAFT_1062020 [Hymenopellis radicata]